MPAILKRASRGVGNGFPPEDCGNDELILSHKILAPLDDSRT